MRFDLRLDRGADALLAPGDAGRGGQLLQQFQIQAHGLFILVSRLSRRPMPADCSKTFSLSRVLIA